MGVREPRRGLKAAKHITTGILTAPVTSPSPGEAMPIN